MASIHAGNEEKLPPTMTNDNDLIVTSETYIRLCNESGLTSPSIVLKTFRA